MKKFILAIMVLLLAGIVPAYAAGKGDTEIVSKKVSKDPADTSSPEWASAKESTIVNDGAAGGPFEKKTLDVKVKSVYTKGGNISVLISWPDSDESKTKDAWKFTKGKWQRLTGDEDKVAINWEIKRIKNFATKGCAVVCHSESKNRDDWKYHTPTATERGDMWVWRAATSQPMAHAEDGYVDDDARKSDAGTGKAKKNEAADKKGPKFVQNPAKKASAPGCLLEDEAVDVKSVKPKEGDIVPGWLLTRFSGSMADVTSKAKYAGGKWTVMLQRKLETSDKENDVQFDTRRDYSLGIAVFNNSAKHNSYNSAPLKVKFD